jgi:aminodeoxyfutalosine deaminase
MPKIDLHLHLEGAISPQCLLTLAQRHGYQDQVSTLEAAEALLKFSTPQEFFQQFLTVSSYITSTGDLRLAVDDVLEHLTRDGVIYAEITIAPRKFLRKGMTYPAMVAELEEAVRQSRARGGPEVRFIVDIVRDLGPDRGLETVETAGQYPSSCVVGIGLGGTEGYPPELSIRPFERAKELGFHLTVHAGEGAGPPSIWGAIQRLGAERIDHGTRAREDPRLLEWLALNHVPLNMCPTSNIRLGVVPGLGNHPVLDYYRLGIPVTVGTDDPSFFGVSLSREIQALANTFQMDERTIVDLQRNAVSASFLSPEEKQILWGRMERDFLGLFPGLPRMSLS